MTGEWSPLGTDENLARAAALVQALPILWSEEDTGAAETDVTARGWFQGSAECARILAARTGLEVCRGGGFGGCWPLLREAGCVVAPALPVVVGEGAATGPDGEYSIDTAGVWREAVGIREPYLVGDTSLPAPGAPFDLLWFTAAERFLVRGGMLEIEDLFGALRVSAKPWLLDRILIRPRRIESGLLSSLPPAASEEAQVIEVRRPVALSTNDRWRDAASFLAARADIECARRRGASLEAQVIGGHEVTFDVEDGPAGWLLTLRTGGYVLTEIRLGRAAMTLGLSATLDPRVDAMAPGMRGRLIFDLRSDLVALGQPAQNR